MHGYKADYKGGSDEETSAYYRSEADKLDRLEAMYTKAITEANILLKQYHIPAATGAH